MIYQLTTQLGSPAVLLRIKTWEPPARQGSVTWSRVLGGCNPCPDMLTAPFVRFPHSGARRGFVSSEDNCERQERRGTCSSAGPGPLQERAGNWFLPTPCVSFPRGRCLHGTGGRLRGGGVGSEWCPQPRRVLSPGPGLRGGGQSTRKETGHTWAPPRARKQNQRHNRERKSHGGPEGPPAVCREPACPAPASLPTGI